MNCGCLPAEQSAPTGPRILNLSHAARQPHGRGEMMAGFSLLFLPWALFDLLKQYSLSFRDVSQLSGNFQVT